MSDESSTRTRHEATAHDAFASDAHAARVLTLPARPASRWHRAGLGARGQRVLDVAGIAALVLLTSGWVWAIATGRTAPATSSLGGGYATGGVAPTIARTLTASDAQSTAYLMGAAVDFFASDRGVSGKLEARYVPAGDTVMPDSAIAGATVRYTPKGGATTTPASVPSHPGVWSIALAIGNAIRPVGNFSLVTLVSPDVVKNGRIGLYFLGQWPKGGGPAKAPPGEYAPPSGFIEVTPENEDTPLSEHFTLKDFLTHDQPNVWPKYLVVRLQLVDKLELVLQDLKEHGVDVSGVDVMSGFRTPQYNKAGGDPTGRAALSRHMYGDAADIFIDDDHNGAMDDLNHDGRVDINDARVILAAEDRVEAAHPELVGGGGVYPAESGHGPFIHIDARGYRARWIGAGGD